MENGSTECEKWKKQKPRKGDIVVDALLEEVSNNSGTQHESGIERRKGQVHGSANQRWNYILLSSWPNF
ncbi:hypothetical protein Hanom_Chr07g00592441 [Helianthus anomalus]